MTDAAGVLALALERPATLGTGRLICIEGPSGSGKSTLARAIAELVPATVVSTDDACPGWDGLPLLGATLAPMLSNLAAGRAGQYRRYDWITGGPAEERTVEPAPLLVLEGVGAGYRDWAGLATVLVWTDAPTDVRRERALARDGDTFAPFWDAWAAAEQTLYAAEQPEQRADLRVRT